MCNEVPSQWHDLSVASQVCLQAGHAVFVDVLEDEEYRLVDPTVAGLMFMSKVW